MGVKKWTQPTKVQAVFMGIFALMLLANNVVSVVIEGRSATVVYWTIQALNLALLVLSFWWYRRAAKSSSKQP
ncbi:hypothetical protein [Arthrobacter sp. H-02-3]|jgi:hypothetical protein|uniref:hypothetical protein n=1 Tax=Arthrobacter sp. H-02-3 TaxID=2703675 RepID=UPI000DD22E7C|nr:hypothetical protein [Arthrobacter sp. H-02-3]PVZ52235.1 hypothetical protein C9424_20710 [Arthrobacter sp. H-02-3]